MSSSDSDTDSNPDRTSSDSDYVTSDEERDDDETKGDLNPLTRSDYDSDSSDGSGTYNWRNAENNRLIVQYIKYHKQQDKEIEKINERLSTLVDTLIHTGVLSRNNEADIAPSRESDGLPLLSPPRAGRGAAQAATGEASTPDAFFGQQQRGGGRKRRRKRKTRKKKHKRKTKKKRKKNRKKRTKRRR